jgi:hypothetical protein
MMLFASSISMTWFMPFMSMIVPSVATHGVNESQLPMVAAVCAQSPTVDDWIAFWEYSCYEQGAHQ